MTWWFVKRVEDDKPILARSSSTAIERKGWAVPTLCCEG